MDFLLIKTCFQGEISECKNKKYIFSEIKTWFQGDISECKNKNGFVQKLKHGSKVKL
jgi:hypothetical protein